ncbi:hypothetical protein [Rhodococcus sp. LB1]|uniref:hypothetical protein n=1 Tax=Rhodococcus sp. LB1 TaxID=1807499 RepID=UPI00077B07E0|nr:hypothetical protein [Rhodococcus sp. LB1]KXX59430.1 hypothetical protein AZG88_41310 [Rhodococcus sp. LB1]
MVNAILILLGVLTLAAASIASWYAFSADRRQSERAYVDWQVTPDEDKVGRFDVYNVGKDTAFDVVVEIWDAHDQVEAKADKVDPLVVSNADIITLELPTRAKSGPDETGTPKPTGPHPSEMHEQIHHGRMIKLAEQSWNNYNEIVRREQGRQVHLRVTWRSKRGSWRTQDLRTG